MSKFYCGVCVCVGLEEQGLYRVVGVSSKVNKLLAMGLDRRKADKLNLDDPLAVSYTHLDVYKRQFIIKKNFFS